MRPERTRICAYALVAEDGKILLCRISPQVPHAAGMWTLPGGGLEFGEDPREAAIREVREETGYETMLISLADVVSDLVELGADTWHVVRIVYYAAVVEGEIRNENDGSTDLAAWFQLTDADGLPLTPLARRAIELLYSP